MNMKETYLFLVLAVYLCRCSGENGKMVGSLSTNAHSVMGEVYSIDPVTIRIVGFSYDGEAPDAYFWISKTSNVPDADGVILPFNPSNPSAILGKYDNVDVTLTLPNGFIVNDLTWISVWCRDFKANFGDVRFPADFISPEALDLGTFPVAATHGVKADKIVFRNAKQIKITKFEYDGEGSDAYFLVGKGTINSINGVKVPNEYGSTEKLGMYSGKDLVITLPAGTTIDDVDWVSVYSEQETSDFGHVMVTHMQEVPPYTDTGYYGEPLGSLTTFIHGVYGDVFNVDNKRIMIRGFNYDGAGPDAYFYIGKKGEHGDTPNGGGLLIADERGTKEKLSAYKNRNIVLELPDDITMSQIQWFSVWCKEAKADFGSLPFPANINVPNPVSLGQFSQLAHSVKSGDVTVINKKQIRIENMEYDGNGPDAFFVVGTGSTVTSTAATKIPDENGSLEKVKKYTGKTIILTLPGETTVDDIDWISLYCILYTENFGDVKLPAMNYFVPPYIAPPMSMNLANCEQMNDKFSVAWEIKEDVIEMEFTADLDGDDGYMAFGLSGENTQSSMLEADVMVVYLYGGVIYLVDYTISGYSLCSGAVGVCPDMALGGVNNVEVITSTMLDGITTVRFARPLDTGDMTGKDKVISKDDEMYIVWAMGNVNNQQQVTKHKQRITDRQTKIHFGRTSSYQCTPIQGEEEVEVTPWDPPKISGMNIKNFNAKIGPTGGKKGYEGITGQVSWGISWYLNGQLIPELTLRRGETYTFKIQGGYDDSNQAKYHPFYITDDPKGGYATKNQQEREAVQIFAGTYTNDSTVYGTDGGYCEYKQKSNKAPEEFATFKDFADDLEVDCDDDTPAGTFTWRVAMDTPNLVYYQCFTHNYLGWKIHVVDDYTEISRAIGVTPASLLISSFVILASLL